MAIEAYWVIFDIQSAGSGHVKPETKELGAKEEATLGSAEFETAGSSLYAKVKSNVARAMVVECLASSADEAAEVVRKYYNNNTGGVHALVKPNTNAKVIA